MTVPKTAVLLAAAVLAANARAELASGIKAIVHDSVITYQEVQLGALPAIETASRQYRNDPDTLAKQINDLLAISLQQLVERQLILHDFKAAGYNLPETIIEESIQERIRDRFGDRKTMTQTLKAQGTTYDKYRQRLRDQFIVEVLTSKNISSEIIISPSKIEKYYQEHSPDYQVEEQVKLRMIVLNRAGASDTNTLARGEEIVSKLKEGASFAEMASVYSQGSQRGDGGDWGWGTRTSLRKELADVAFNLKAGEISQVIATPEACFIMKVEEIKPAHTRPLAEVHGEIERNLKEAEQARLRNQYIEKLKKKTFVRYF